MDAALVVDHLVLLVGVKATYVVGCAAVLAVLLGRRPHRERAALWHAALVALLLLPLAQASLPGVVSGWPSAAAPDRDAEAPVTVRLRPAPAARGPAEAGAAWSAHVVKPTPAAEAKHRARPVPALLAGAYLLGAAVWLLLLAGAHGRARGWRARARPVSPGADALARDVARGLGVRGPIPVRLTEHRMVPAVVGVLRPVILVPQGAELWDEDTWRAVLLHETAHVARRDPLLRTLVEIACALFWLNPLVWAAARAARRESESASDALALAGGMRPSEYSVRLLRLFRDARSLRPVRAGAVGMASGRGLRRRIERLGDARAGTSGRARAAAGLVAAACLPLGVWVPATGEPTAGPVGRSIPFVPTAIGATSPPHQARWFGPEGWGAAFLDASAGQDGFLLLVAEARATDGALRAYQAVPGGATLVRDGGGWEAVAAEPAWLTDAASRAAAKLGPEAARAHPLLSGAAPTADGRVGGAVLRGLPAISVDGRRGVVQAGWTAEGVRYGVIASLRRPGDLRRLDRAREEDLAAWVGFRWERGAGLLEVVDSEWYSSSAGLAAPGAGDRLRRDVIDGLRALARDNWIPNEGGR